MAESLKMPAVAALGRAETKTAAIRRRPRRVYKTLCDRSTSSVSCARCSSISDGGGGEGGHAGECGTGGAEVRGGESDVRRFRMELRRRLRRGGTDGGEQPHDDAGEMELQLLDTHHVGDLMPGQRRRRPVLLRLGRLHHTFHPLPLRGGG